MAALMEGKGVVGLKEGNLGLEECKNGFVGFRVWVWEGGGLDEGKERRAVSILERERDWS